MEPKVHSLSDEKLEIAEKTAIRELSNARGSTYAQRNAFAFAWIRIVVERAVREAERRAGLR